MEQYVTLFSNSNNDYFINSADHFKVKLPKALKFDKKWKVGLCEIHYNKTWFNIPERQNLKIIVYNHAKNDEYDCQLPEGYYSIEKLCQALNIVMENSIKSGLMAPKIHYNKAIDKVEIKFGVDNGRQIFVKLNDDLYNILGIEKTGYERTMNETLNLYYTKTAELREIFKNDELVFYLKDPGNVKYTAEKTFDITGGYHSFFIYTDIIKPTYVGDSFSPLLKIVEIPSNVEFGEKISINYPNVQYFPLENNEIQSIEIKIADDLGKPIKFVAQSLTIVKLHFVKS